MHFHTFKLGFSYTSILLELHTMATLVYVRELVHKIPFMYENARFN